MSSIRPSFHPSLCWAISLGLVFVSASASAAWWKGNGWSKNGSLNTDYWDGFSISYEIWYAPGGHDAVTAALWEETEAIFEGQDTPTP